MSEEKRPCPYGCGYDWPSPGLYIGISFGGAMLFLIGYVHLAGLEWSLAVGPIGYLVNWTLSNLREKP